MSRRFAALRPIALMAAALCLLGHNGQASPRQKNPKPGPLSGAWECIAHGAPQGDMRFTLDLEQVGQTITGSVTSPIGSTEIADATYRKSNLTISIELGEGDTYQLSGRLKKDELSGSWTRGNERGTWTGAKTEAK